MQFDFKKAGFSAFLRYLSLVQFFFEVVERKRQPRLSSLAQGFFFLEMEMLWSKDKLFEDIYKNQKKKTYSPGVIIRN